MPSFATQLPDLRNVGPVVDLSLAVPGMVEETMRKSGGSIPSPIRVLAMIDTGATGSVISRGLASKLGLSPIGVTNIHTPSSNNVACYEYPVRFVFPNNVLFEGTIIEAPLQGQHIQCLIGRDVLGHGVLVYIGYANIFSLSF